jgi:YVTN family beta-propeller protein
MRREVKRVKKKFVFMVLALGLLMLFAATQVHAIGVIATITVGKVPGPMAYDSGKGLIYVGNTNIPDTTNPGSVSVISDSTNAVIATVPVGIFPCIPVYDSGKGEIF